MNIMLDAYYSVNIVLSAFTLLKIKLKYCEETYKLHIPFLNICVLAKLVTWISVYLLYILGNK